MHHVRNDRTTSPSHGLGPRRKQSSIGPRHRRYRRVSIGCALVVSLALDANAAASFTYDPHDLFGLGPSLPEMTYNFGAEFGTSYPACRRSSGSLVLTPKALRLYFFRDDGAKEELAVSNRGMERVISYVKGGCRVDFHVSRRESPGDNSVDLAPAEGSGFPGPNNHQVSIQDSYWTAAAFFPTTTRDCGQLSAALYLGEQGITFLTTADRFFLMSSSKRNDVEHQERDFVTKDCTTTFGFEAYVMRDGAWQTITFAPRKPWKKIQKDRTNEMPDKTTF